MFAASLSPLWRRGGRGQALGSSLPPGVPPVILGRLPFLHLDLVLPSPVKCRPSSPESPARGRAMERLAADNSGVSPQGTPMAASLIQQKR